MMLSQVEAMRDQLRPSERKLADYVINPNIALVSMFMCARSDEEARAKARAMTEILRAGVRLD